MTAGVLSWKISTNKTITTANTKSNPKATSVKKLRRYTTRNLRSTSSNIVLRIYPKSSVTGKMVEFIMFCFFRKILIDLHYSGCTSWLTSRLDGPRHNEPAAKTLGVLGLINTYRSMSWDLLHVWTHGGESKKRTQIWNWWIWPKWNSRKSLLSNGIVREGGSLSFGERLL